MHAVLATLGAKEFAGFAAETQAQLAHVLPEVVVTLGCALVVTWSVGVGTRGSRVLAWPTLATLLGALLLTLSRWGEPVRELFSGMVRVDALANLTGVVALLGGAGAVILVESTKELDDRPRGELYGCLLAATLGMQLLAASVDLIGIFVAMELLSIPSYVMVGWLKKSGRASEAALKYVIYGSVAAGVMVYGFSLLYGMTGTLRLAGVARLVQSPDADALAVGLAAVLALSGYAFKVAAVPMHFWAPDVYQGAPTAVTAWLSVASKAAGVAGLLRFAEALGVGRVSAVGLDWVSLAALLAAVTMTLGNLGALHQTSLKRLLAYSSVAHVGYLLMGVAALGGRGAAAGQSLSAVVFYVIAYLVMNLGAFAVVALVESRTGSDDVQGFRGLYARAPRLALALTVLIISLIGIPPTIGFAGKFQLFLVTVDEGLFWLAVVAALNTAVSAYYYLRVVKAVFLEDAPEGAAPIAPPLAGEALALASAALAVYLGIFFQGLADACRRLGPLY